MVILMFFFFFKIMNKLTQVCLNFYLVLDITNVISPILWSVSRINQLRCLRWNQWEWEMKTTSFMYFSIS